MRYRHGDTGGQEDTKGGDGWLGTQRQTHPERQGWWAGLWSQLRGFLPNTQALDSQVLRWDWAAVTLPS